MDFKLKIMKFRTIISILLLILTSCKTYHGDKFYYRGELKSNEKFWINSFKYHVFYECLKEGYQNDSIFKLMGKKDLFYPSDDINLSYPERALGKKIIENMPLPYIHIDDKDITGMNFISASCVQYYASRELDSIAKKYYKDYLKSEKKFERILDSIYK